MKRKLRWLTTLMLMVISLLVLTGMAPAEEMPGPDETVLQSETGMTESETVIPETVISDSETEALMPDTDLTEQTDIQSFSR